MTAEAPLRFSEAAMAEYRDILTRYPTRRAALMPVLWLAQREFGWLSQPAMEHVAEIMELPVAWVSSCASFYTMYWKAQPGRWHLQICRSLACELRGARRLIDAVEDKLGIADGQQTRDGRFSLEEVECLASCGTAPCMQVNNDAYHENLSLDGALALIDRLATEK